MKKTTATTSTSEPMGIVISTGIRAPVEPRVRAYVWGQWSEEPVLLSFQPTALSHSD